MSSFTWTKTMADAAVTELSTMKDMIRWAMSRFQEAELFFGHGTDNSWDEAVALVLSSLHLGGDIEPTLIDSTLTKAERRKVMSVIEQRVKHRVPLPYLLNEAWFAGLAFYVDHRVLIPRSPFAELLESRCMPWVDPENVHRVLDMCTGCGCIAIAAAMAFPESKVDAIDIDSDALEVADINRSHYDLDERVELLQSDLFNELKGRKYDLILCNPPYVDAIEMELLPDEFRHEPESALAAGDDGLDIINRLLASAADFLTPNGVLMVEVGASQQAVIDAYPQHLFTWLDFENGGEGMFVVTASELNGLK